MIFARTAAGIGGGRRIESRRGDVGCLRRKQPDEITVARDRLRIQRLFRAAGGAEQIVDDLPLEFLANRGRR